MAHIVMAVTCLPRLLQLNKISNFGGRARQAAAALPAVSFSFASFPPHFIRFNRSLMPNIIPKIDDLVFGSDVRISPSMSEDANVMTEATPRHLFWRFFRESNTSFQDLAGANRALARTSHAWARCIFSSRTPASWSRGRTAASSSESTNSRVKLLLSKKNGPIWDVSEAAMIFFCWKIHPGTWAKTERFAFCFL